jgi:hypothetical protein
MSGEFCSAGLLISSVPMNIEARGMFLEVLHKGLTHEYEQTFIFGGFGRPNG